MNIFFRVDASEEIGTGHVMRCITLADELQSNGANIFFICRELKGNLIGYIEDKGYKVFTLKNVTDIQSKSIESLRETKNCSSIKNHFDWLETTWQEDANQVRKIIRDFFENEGNKIEWLIVDHYALDEKWEKKLRPYTKKIMIIDDLANRSHDCDLLLDQNLCENMERRYDELVPRKCQKLLGPQFALLRPEFKEARKNLKKRDGQVKRILVFFGGVDPTNETVKALQAIQMLETSDITIDVVVGKSNPHKNQVAKYCNSMPNTNFYCQVENMAELMAQADLAIGAGGVTTWERCYLGLPAIVLTTANNQKNIINAVSKKKAIVYLGEKENITSKHVYKTLNKVIFDKKFLKKMGKEAFKIMNIRENKESIISKFILERKNNECS